METNSYEARRAPMNAEQFLAKCAAQHKTAHEMQMRAEEIYTQARLTYEKDIQFAREVRSIYGGIMEDFHEVLDHLKHLVTQEKDELWERIHHLEAASQKLHETPEIYTGPAKESKPGFPGSAQNPEVHPHHYNAIQRLQKQVESLCRNWRYDSPSDRETNAMELLKASDALREVMKHPGRSWTFS